jgi:hypothetical protein
MYVIFPTTSPQMKYTASRLSVFGLWLDPLLTGLGLQTWNTGPLLSDSCGYIALDHEGERVIVAFRGTYSITNTIVDLATIPQEYVPYPGDPEDDAEGSGEPEGSYRDDSSWHWRWMRKAKQKVSPASTKHDGEGIMGGGKPGGPKCNNCTVHMGFFSSWKNTRGLIIPHLKRLHESHPSYQLHLVGHSLGGAVAALAGLETHVLGWNPTVTTFGEPRIGNIGLNQYLDELFNLNSGGRSKEPDWENEIKNMNNSRYRRLTHIHDPVPLLPLTEWGYHMHAGEIYISRPDLQPSVPDLYLCSGDEDPQCIFGAEAEAPFGITPGNATTMSGSSMSMLSEGEVKSRWGLPERYRMWQLFFAHRDYFWRLGLCVPGGDPADWGRRPYHVPGEERWDEL